MNDESKIVGGIGGGPAKSVGIQTYPPDVDVKPGPPPPKEIRENLDGWSRVLELDAPAADVFIGRLCLTWTMWKKAEDKARTLGEELAAAKQDSSNQRAIAEKATRDAVMVRAQLISKGITPDPLIDPPPPAPASSASPDRSAEEEA
jgi:hypothetical protein